MDSPSFEHDHPNSQLPVIGVILKGYPRLSETFILNEILLLEEQGFRLHIFALRNPGELKVHETVRKVKASVTYIPDYFWQSFFAIVGSNLRLFFNRPKIYCKPFLFALLRSFRRWSSSTIKRFSQAAYLVAESLPGTGTRHFYAHFSHGPTTVAYFASKLSGINYSFSAHAKDIYVQEHELLKEKILNAGFVVTCTEFNRSYLESIAGKEGLVYRCYHGVDPEKFRSVLKTPAIQNVPVILSVGRFIPKKGFPVLVQALQRVKERNISFRAFLIGGGEMKAGLKDQVRAAGLSQEVKILDQMAQEELQEYYKKASLFVLACQVEEDGDRDGIPNVLVEAMAMGIPVVSTNISGIPELIEYERSGFLVAERDAEALAEAIVRVLTNSQLAEKLSRGGQAKVLSEFDSRKNVKAIGDLLRKVLIADNRNYSTDVALPHVHDGKPKTTIYHQAIETTGKNRGCHS